MNNFGNLRPLNKFPIIPLIKETHFVHIAEFLGHILHSLELFSYPENASSDMNKADTAYTVSASITF